MFEAICLHSSFVLKRKNDKFCIKWNSLAKNVFVVHKLDDPEVIAGIKAVVYYLLKYLCASVFLEESSIKTLSSDPEFARIINSHRRENVSSMCEKEKCSTDPGERFVEPTELDKIQSYADVCWQSNTHMVNPMSSVFVFDSDLAKQLQLTDMIICMGGDGTLLHVASIFQVLNETTFARGNCPYLSNLALAVDNKEVTRIQADGLIVSTPTGSTAYSMSAGASILNSAVPAILITPVNPHSLSCRPLVLPMSTAVEVSIGEDSRGECMHLSNDGRLQNRHIIYKGDRVLITASHYPVPCFTSDSPVADWFRDLANCLNWNVRHRQNQLNESRFVQEQLY